MNLKRAFWLAHGQLAAYEGADPGGPQSSGNAAHWGGASLSNRQKFSKFPEAFVRGGVEQARFESTQAQCLPNEIDDIPYPDFLKHVGWFHGGARDAGGQVNSE